MQWPIACPHTVALPGEGQREEGAACIMFGTHGLVVNPAYRSESEAGVRESVLENSFIAWMDSGGIRRSGIKPGSGEIHTFHRPNIHARKRDNRRALQ